MLLKPMLPRATCIEKRALTPEEARRLYQAAGHPVCARFIAIALATGARAGAITDLTWDRVDMERRTIDFRAPISRADRRKARPIVAVTEELLTIIGAHDPDLEGHVINMTRPYIYRLVRAAAQRAGLGNDVTPHTLRRTAATTLVRSLSIDDAQHMLGHRTAKVTEASYVKLDPEDLRAAVEANAPMIRSLARLHPSLGSVKNHPSNLYLHLADRETDAMIRKLAVRLRMSPQQAISIACEATLSSLNEGAV